ncbi:MAG: phosphoheptose isomerase [Haliscomenobacter sp.]|nr:phosphoheptose isomerase [Haliscomenobacter sp.]MBK8879060.1 phosphoheptose isomerase [Haliscomenobacter sp.]
MSVQLKDDAFAQAMELAADGGFRIVKADGSRPWGGFLVLDEAQAAAFAARFFSDVPQEDILKGNKLSPKILLVAPGQRLSWQYHFRRAEFWKVVQGPVAVATSRTDEQSDPEIYPAGSIIRLQQGERHRLIGLAGWGIVAEIWQHTNPDHPSDEEDIVRLQDDYDRR